MRSMLRWGASLAIACVALLVVFPLILNGAAEVSSSLSERVVLLIAQLTGSSAAAPGPDVAGAPDCGIDPLLASLEARDPLADARAAVEKGNFALLGVRGSALEIPGPKPLKECLARALGVAAIPDTSDTIRCPEHGRLQVVARAFAERYNGAIYEALHASPPAAVQALIARCG